MTSCPSHSETYPTAHTCTDPLACALASLANPDPQAAEIAALHALLDQVEDICDASTAKWANTVLSKIHVERGGPR